MAGIRIRWLNHIDNHIDNSNSVRDIVGVRNEPDPTDQKTKIPPVSLASDEKLYVILTPEPGSFFGQLEKIPVKDLNDMTSELMLAYSNPNPTLLYADCKSHLGHCGVVHWEDDNKFYRIRVIDEFPNNVQVNFVDYGNNEKIPKRRIFAPLESLTCFRNSPFGIHCKMDDVTLSPDDWSKVILEKKIRVNIGKYVDEAYSVTLTDDPCNHEIAKAISSMTSPKCTSIPENSVRNDSVAVENAEQTTRSNNEFIIGERDSEVDSVTLTEDPSNDENAEVTSELVQSSSGLFTVNIFWHYLPSTSGVQKPQALPNADSRVEEASETEIQNSARKSKKAKKNTKKKAKELEKSMKVPVVKASDEEALSDHHLSDTKFQARDQDNGSN